MKERYTLVYKQNNFGGKYSTNRTLSLYFVQEVTSRLKKEGNVTIGGISCVMTPTSNAEFSYVLCSPLTNLVTVT